MEGSFVNTLDDFIKIIVVYSFYLGQQLPDIMDEMPASHNRVVAYQSFLEEIFTKVLYCCRDLFDSELSHLLTELGMRLKELSHLFK